MSEPVSCKWCGAAQSGTDGDDILFACGSWHSGSTPEYQWNQCKLNVAEQRIRRAVELLQNLEDVTVTSGDGHLELMVCAHAVDHAVAILQEGQP